MNTNDPRVGEIEARLAAATPGPWEVDAMDAGHSRFDMNVWVTAGAAGDTVCDMDGLSRSHNEDVAKDDGYADATFIAHAPADVAYLLAELRKAHEALARVDDLADAFVKRGEHLIEFAKTAPDDVAESLTESDGDFLHKGRLIRAAVAAANGDA